MTAYETHNTSDCDSDTEWHSISALDKCRVQQYIALCEHKIGSFPTEFMKQKISPLA